MKKAYVFPGQGAQFVSMGKVETTHIACPLDTEREEYDCGWYDRLCGMRAWNGADGIDWKDTNQLEFLSQRI